MAAAPHSAHSQSSRRTRSWAAVSTIGRSSVNVRFLRAVIHQSLGGRWWLRLLFWLEERFPHYFGEKGQYPLVIVRKNSHE